jgi:DMSO reductase anchor subunit
MHTDKALLLKGLKYLAYTVALMFAAPFALYQAFRNQEHPLYIPVLVFGLLLALAAIGTGFYGIKTIVDALFGKRPKDS